MADETFGPKVYRDSNGDRLNVVSGGALNLEEGSSFSAPRLINGVAAANASTGGTPGLPIVFEVPLSHTTAGAQTVDTTFAHRFEVIDVVALKTGGGSSATTVLTVQVQDGSGNAITNAFSIKGVDKTIFRPGTIDDAYSKVGTSAGGTLRVVRAGSAGTSANKNGAIIRVIGLKRST